MRSNYILIKFYFEFSRFDIISFWTTLLFTLLTALTLCSQDDHSFEEALKKEFVLESEYINILEGFDSENITEYGLFYADSTRLLTPTELINNSNLKTYPIGSKSIINKRRKGANCWIIFPLKNPSSSEINLRLTRVSDVLTYHFYLLDESGAIVDSQKAGKAISPFDHTLWYKDPAFSIKVSAYSKMYVLIMIGSYDLFYERFELKTIPIHQRETNIRVLKEGIIHGLLIVVVIISLILFFITKKKINLYYFLYVGSNAFALHIAIGFFNYLFFPDFAFAHYAQYASVLITSILFFRFIILYYQEQGLSLKFNIAYWSYTIPLLVFVFFMIIHLFFDWTFPYASFLERVPMVLLSLMSIFAYGIIIFYAFKKPTWSNILFALAFVLLLYFAVITVLFRNGYLSNSIYPVLGYEMAVVVEFIFLTFLLSHKVLKAYRENAVMQLRLDSQKIELENAEQIKKANDDKDTLLREIHHRVKNNLQVISALLTLQSSHIKDAKAKTALQEGQDRVQSMALIHKDLYQHDNLKGVNTKDYLEQLTKNLMHSYKVDDSSIDLVTDIEEIKLDVDTMIPLGLMVNELISNALKHAFTAKENGQLSIFLKEKDNTLLLDIKDNGVGVNDIDYMQSKSFGYSLIRSFARKLDADLNIINDNGLRVSLLIKAYQKAEY